MEDILEKAIANLQNEFPGEANTGELLVRVQEILPMTNTEYKIVDVKGTSSNFKANVKVDFKNEADVDLFVRNYSYKNNETLRILKTRKSVNKKAKTTLVKYFRCHHNTRHEPTKLPDQVLASKPTKRFKNTNCPFSLIVRIGQNTEDEHFSSSIDIEWSHNHSVDSLHSLSFRDIPDSMIRQIKEMFARGLLPAAALPLILYEGLHDRIVSLSAVNQQSNFLELPLDDAIEGTDLTSTTLPGRNKQQDLVTAEECGTALDKMVESLKKKLEGSDQNFLRGVLKFADRAQNMQKSKLATCFHSFGTASIYNARQTTTSIVKKARRGKIPVQPTAVARRKVVDGTRRRQPQGQRKTNNPFRPVAGKTKRTHQLAFNVNNNEPVAKKAGRNMATKTRIYEQK